MDRLFRTIGRSMIRFALLAAFGCGGDSLLGTIDGGPEDGADNAPDEGGTGDEGGTIHDEGADVCDERECTVDAYLLRVCGEDGRTYSNPEYAACCGVDIAYYGACTEPDSPGTCLAISGPPGIFREYRSHDLGVVAVGDAREITILLDNRCRDALAELLAFEWPDGAGDFAVTSGPAAGFVFPADGPSTAVVVTFQPLAPGMQHARLRISLNHGYYDVELAAEGVSPGGSPAPLDLDCLDPDPTLDFGPFPLSDGAATIDFELPLLCAYTFGTEHFVVESVTLTAGTAAFDFQPWASYSGLVPNLQQSSPLPLVMIRFSLTFAPPGVGTTHGEVTLETNDRTGTYVIGFDATAT